MTEAARKALMERGAVRLNDYGAQMFVAGVGVDYVLAVLRDTGQLLPEGCVAVCRRCLGDAERGPNCKADSCTLKHKEPTR